MPTIVDPCAGAITAPVCDPCFTNIERARVRGTAFIHSSYMPTLLAAKNVLQTWTDGIAAEVIHMIPETSGTYDGGSPVEGAGFGDEESRLTGFKFTSAFKDPSYEANTPFYNSIIRSRGWYYAFRTETLTRISGKPVTIIPKSPVADDLNGEIVWDVEVKWAERDHPVPFETPADLFICPNS